MCVAKPALTLRIFPVLFFFFLFFRLWLTISLCWGKILRLEGTLKSRHLKNVIKHLVFPSTYSWRISFPLSLWTLFFPVINTILSRCTPYIRCQAAQRPVGFSNRLKISNFLIGNNAIIHVPLYQLPSYCLALLRIWHSWCALSQRSMRKERCYTNLENRSSKEIFGTKKLHPNLGTTSAGSLDILNMYSAPLLGVTYSWDICTSLVCL